MSTGYRVLKPDPTAREIADAVNSLRAGRVNTVGNVALGTGATTVVTNFYAHSSATVGITPMNAAAAASDIFLSSLGDQTFTMGHSASTATRLVRYVVLG